LKFLIKYQVVISEVLLIYGCHISPRFLLWHNKLAVRGRWWIPSRPHSITAICTASNYIAWWEKQCMYNLPSDTWNWSHKKYVTFEFNSYYINQTSLGKYQMVG